jgi:hypothetical protein
VITIVLSKHLLKNFTEEKSRGASMIFSTLSNNGVPLTDAISVAQIDPSSSKMDA